MTTDGTDHFLDVKEFATQIQEELIQSTSEGPSLFRIILRKAFVTKSEELSVFQFIPGARLAFVIHNFLKKADILLVISTVFDFMFGCGSGRIPYGIYNRLKHFGSILFIPLMATVSIILGLNGFIDVGIWNIWFKVLITSVFIIKDFIPQFHTPISYDSSVLCISETCIECQLPFSQPLLSSTKICICVCQNCFRKSDECTKCQSSPCTGRYTITL